MPFIAPIVAAIGGALATTTFIGLTVGQVLAIGLTVIGGLNARRQARKAAAAARDAYNASLKDRMESIRSPIASREMVLGRVRKTGAYTFVDTEGANKEFMWAALTLAGHECDAIEKVYFNDIEVTIDGSTGAVSGGPYTKSAVKSVHTAAQQITAGVMTYTFTLTGYVDGSASVRNYGSPYSASAGDGDFEGSYFVQTYRAPPTPGRGNSGTVIGGTGGAGSWSVSGSTLTVTYTALPTVGSWIAVNHDQSYLIPRAWCWKFLGASGEDFAPQLRAAFPGKWTSAHQQSGCCKLLLKFQYDQDVFPQGSPTVSALIRGAKVLDIRTGVTAWSENPALLIYHVATHPQFGKQPTSSINTADVIAAANACDTSSTYTVGGATETRPLYTAGIVAKWGARPQDVIGELAEAMAGKFAVSAGVLSMRAGVYIAPSLDLTDDDFSDVDTVQIVATAPRENTFNAVTGTFSDPANQYLQGDFPKIAPSALISADGGIELPADIEMGGVNHAGQAQHICGVMLRDSRQALTVTASFKLSAYQLEVFDTCTLTSSVFGWSAKKFEVVNREWSMIGGVRLTLKETDPSIYTMDSTFTAYDPAPNSNLPSFWNQVGTGALTITSDDTTLIYSADGSYAGSFNVSWPAIADKAVSSPSGKVEVAYIIDGADTGGVWQSVIVDGDSTSAKITGVIPGYRYRARTRTYNGIAWSMWMASGGVVVAGKTGLPPDVVGLTATQTTGGVRVSWNANPDQDGASTQVRIGSDWATATLLRDTSRPLNNFVWEWPSSGTYTLTAKHFDNSGNESSTAASVTVTVVGQTIALATENIKTGAATTVIPVSVAGPVMPGSGFTTAATVTYGPFPVDCKVNVTASFNANCAGSTGLIQSSIDHTIGGIIATYLQPTVNGANSSTITATADYFGGTVCTTRLLFVDSLGGGSLSDIKFKIEVVKL